MRSPIDRRVRRVLAAALLVVGPGGCGVTPQTAEVRIHSGGAPHPVEDGARAEEITSAVLAALESATDRLQLLVTEERIARIRSGEAVEIVFVEPATLTPGIGGARSVGLLLVPLEPLSPRADPALLQIYWGVDSYGSGPFVADGSEVLPRLRSLAAEATAP